MKTTVGVNLAGLPFIIDIDAHTVLRKYIDYLGTYYSTEPDAKEIITDIEIRISELFITFELSDKIITIFHIKHIIEIIGTPGVDGECNEHN